MRRTSSISLVAGALAVALTACGDSGSATGLPPGPYGYGPGNDSARSDNEPPTTDNEVPTSFTEGALCGGEEEISRSYVALEFELPLCEFSKACSNSSAESVAPGGEGTEPYDGPSESDDYRDAFTDIPEFCSELVMAQDIHGGQDGELDDCAFIEAIGWVAQQYPTCEQTVPLPQGVCKASFERCVSDVLKAGCGPYLAGRLPRSCQGLISADSDSQETKPKPGSP